MQSHTVVRFATELLYYVKQPAVLKLVSPPVTSGMPGFEPTTLVTLLDSCPDPVSFLKEKLRIFEATDDVYNSIFSANGSFVLQYTEDLHISLEDIEAAVVRAFGEKKHLTFHCATKEGALPEGPYFRSGSFLHQAWRVYADDLRAFTVATIPIINPGIQSSSDHENRYLYEPFLGTSSYGNERGVAVPSRLYNPPTDKYPLRGARVSIKDSVHLAGIKTSMGSRSYIDFYGPQTETADYVKFLIDQGAIIIGKSAMNAWAGSEGPPNHVVDYFPPWSPRADGYQKTAGSSSGAGASIAGYPWCDLAIGTDTTGSGREPARALGLQGLKLSLNILSTKGLEPSSREFDSWSFFSRGLDELYTLVDVSTGGGLSTKLPTKLLYPTDWLPYKIPEQQKMNEEFLVLMEEVLGVKHTKICLADIWEQFPPKEASGKSIAEFLENTGFWPMYYDNYHEYDNFRNSYEKKFGKPVYTSPSQTWKWDLGSTVTPEQRTKGLSECNTFKDWVEKHILTRNADGDGEAVIFLPLGNANPDYRDVPAGQPRVVKSFEPKYFGSILGLPQIITPIGQLPYESRISKRREFVPVIATFAGAQGSDLMLVKVAQLSLKKGGRPTTVLTGRNSFLVDGEGSNEGI